MKSYKEFKEEFLEEFRKHCEKVGWDKEEVFSPMPGKNSWTNREIYEDMVNETGIHGNTIRECYKYKYECEKGVQNKGF